MKKVGFELGGKNWSSPSSRTRVMNHNWSARKQHLRLQSAAGISRHSALSEDRVSPQGHKSPFPSAGTAVSVFCAKMVQ